MLAQKKYTNATTLQIDNLDKLLVEIDKELKGILSKIFNMWSIYSKHLDQVHKTVK